MARADMRYLEWNGPSLRVKVRVSGKALPVIGKAFLKRSLHHGDIEKAQVQKYAIVAELKAEIRGAERRAARQATSDPMELLALQMRERVEDEARQVAMVRQAFSGSVDEPLTADELLKARREFTLDDEIGVTAEHIERTRGREAAREFFDVAYGRATPLGAHLEEYLKACDFDAKGDGRVRRAVRRLEGWCDRTQTRNTLEAVTPLVASRFEDEALSPDDYKPATFRANRSALSGYWEWLLGRGQVSANPWKGRMTRRAKPHREEDENATKRPFTDDEVAALLAGDAPQRLRDVMLIAALSGMRLGEIIALRRKHSAGGFFVVAKGKTRAGKRRVPIHSALAETLVRLMNGKGDDDYLIDGLDEPPSDSERSRASPVSKQFTRYRRKLGVDATGDKRKQSAIDFHSFRRWFIKKRVDALNDGAKGFSWWTIADVVGHDTTTDGPLAMTMGRYPGKASDDAMRACVEATGGCSDARCGKVKLAIARNG